MQIIVCICWFLFILIAFVDRICSIDKVSHISSVVLVIHGTDDEVIDLSHGHMIYQRCPRTVEPLWVDGAGHNDVEMYEQYLERLIRFIEVELPISWQADPAILDRHMDLVHWRSAMRYFFDTVCLVTHCQCLSLWLLTTYWLVNVISFCCLQ